MGTSASSRGPGSNSPLIPPWADPEPGQPLPPPPETPRFQPFRTHLGKYVSSGNSYYLHKSIGEYARRSTGGAATGPRRFGSVTTAGGVLFDVLNNLRQGGTAEQIAGVDLSALNGKDIDFAIQEIVTALTPNNGDADKIRAAMTMALSECLEGLEEFNATTIDDGMLIDILVYYLRECVFEQVVMDSGKAFQKAIPERVLDAEEALHSLIESVVDKHMRILFSDGITSLNQQRVSDIQKQAILEVWVEWEGYEP